SPSSRRRREKRPKGSFARRAPRGPRESRAAGCGRRLRVEDVETPCDCHTARGEPQGPPSIRPLVLGGPLALHPQGVSTSPAVIPSSAFYTSWCTGRYYSQCPGTQTELRCGCTMTTSGGLTTVAEGGSLTVSRSTSRVELEQAERSPRVANS